MNTAAGGKSQGYTILETMIFLAVSAAMFFSAMAFVSGKQNRTEFASTVRNTELTLTDVANDVSNGYYDNLTQTNQGVSCTANDNSAAKPVTLTATSNDFQGSNGGCIFIGKVLIFAPQNLDASSYSVIPIVGRQFKNADASQGDVQTYADSRIWAVAPDSSGTGSTIDASIRSVKAASVEFGCVFYGNAALSPPESSPCTNTPGSIKVDNVAFLTQFHGTNSVTGDAETGSNQVNLVVPKVAPGLPRNQSNAVTSINQYTDNPSTINIVINPPGGVYVCLQSTGSKQHALITLGGSSSKFIGTSAIVAGDC